MTTESEAPAVIVGVDGSAESVRALQWAARYAADTGAHLRAVLCWHYPGTLGVAPIGKAPEPVTDEVRQHLDETLAKAIADGGRMPRWSVSLSTVILRSVLSTSRSALTCSWWAIAATVR